MKRFFWMVLIFTFLFSLTALFAQQEVSASQSSDESKVTIEKSGKKVSEMRKVYVRHNDKRNHIIPEKNVEVKSNHNQLQTGTTTKASQDKSEVSSNKIQVHKNVSEKKASPVFNKKPKALPVQSKTTD